MEETYDYVFLGTGLKECILSGLMSIEGKKILHIDRNSFYGGKITSVTPLQSLFDMFNVSKPLDDYKKGKEWNVDLVPKFLMANGKLVMLLVHTGVLKYLEFKQIEGSYVYQSGAIHKVPCNEAEALSSNLMNLFEKRRFRKFLVWVMNADPNDVSTWNGVYAPPLDIKKDNILHAFNAMNVDESTQNFIGHAICLYPDDSYKQSVPALEVIQRMQLYSKSVFRYGKSPYVYPLYGLGELAQSFARLSAVHGGTYMLNTPVDEIVMENGKVVGVKSDGKIARCNAVICDSSYAPDKVKKVGQGFFIVLVATTVETAKPHDELKPGLDLLGDISQVFYSVDDLVKPVNDGRETQLFISSSYDASTHFETTCTDVLDLYTRLTGQPFDFSKVKEIMTKWNVPEPDE